MARKGAGPKTKGRLANALSKAQNEFAERSRQKRAAEAAKEREANERRGPRKGAASDRTRKPVVPFQRGQRVLLIGEGNFSFAHALVKSKPAIVTAHLLVATSYDSFDQVRQKYADAEDHINAVKAAGAQVLYSVDATALDKHKELKTMQFDRIVFNFPHTGQGITDQARNVIANQTILLGFFRSSAGLLRPGKSSAPVAGSKKRKRGSDKSDDEASDAEDAVASDNDDVGEDASLAPVPPSPETRGRVQVTLRTGKPYDLWCLPQLATKGAMLAPSILGKSKIPPQPSYSVVRSFAFDPSQYEGYEHRRTIGFKEGVSSEKNDDLALTARERGLKKSGHQIVPARQGVEARTWEFELKDLLDEHGSPSMSSKGKKKRRVDEDRLEDDDY